MTKVRRDEHENIRKMRRGGMTYQAIADHFSITRERVRQILDKYKETDRILLSPHA